MIIPRITYQAYIWHLTNSKKRHRKAMLMQLAQVKVFGAWLITEAFKATSTQTLNIEAYLILIRLKQNKKDDQTAARLYTGLLHLIITLQ